MTLDLPAWSEVALVERLAGPRSGRRSCSRRVFLLALSLSLCLRPVRGGRAQVLLNGRGQMSALGIARSHRHLQQLPRARICELGEQIEESRLAQANLHLPGGGVPIIGLSSAGIGVL